MSDLGKKEEKLDINTAKRLIKYAFFHKRRMFLGLFLLIFAMSAQFAAPFAIGEIMDKEMTRANIIMPNILKLSGIYVLLVMLDSFFSFLSGLEFRVVAMKIITRMRNELYSKIQSMPISYFDNVPVGSIVSKITNDTNAVQGLYMTVMGQIVMSVGYIIGLYIVLFAMNPFFGGVVLLILPIIVFAIIFYSKRASIYNDKIRTLLTQIMGSLNEIVQGMPIIQAFNRQKQIFDEFEALVKKRRSYAFKMVVLDSMGTYNIIAVVKDISLIVLIYFFGKMFLDGSSLATVGGIYIYIQYLNILFNNLTRITEQLRDMQKAGAAAKHIFEVLDMKSMENVGKSDVEESSIKGEVIFENVSFYYKDNEYVLNDINIKVKNGQNIGLVGHTGSGKSSIMNLLMKFYAPQKGRILIDGLDLVDLSDKFIRKQMGIVLQEPFLFSGTILSNITLNNTNITRDDAINALKMVGGEELLLSLKNGIDTQVVERGATLSSGQRQLISFARALAHNPKILILDEATSSIDSETEQIIQNAMQVLMKGRTTFVIAHRLSTIKNADRIYLLDRGRILEEGNHEELIELRGKYYNMYQMQGRG
jgi:multidrug ABC superfamily ATP binding cassette transporter, ABC protein